MGTTTFITLRHSSQVCHNCVDMDQIWKIFELVIVYMHLKPKHADMAPITVINGTVITFNFNSAPIRCVGTLGVLPYRQRLVDSKPHKPIAHRYDT